jgi:hypothetical protein
MPMSRVTISCDPAFDRDQALCDQVGLSTTHRHE